MDTDERAMFVPLRSNARTLLAGRPVGIVRRRLKQASLIYDSIYLEDGALTITAGPNGAIVMPVPTSESTTFQTAQQRHTAPGQRFVMSLGEESAPGVPSDQLRNFINSETSILWVPTLTPFARELPSGCSWVQFVRPQSAPEVKRTAEEWKRRDLRNESLRTSLPVQFVRSTVVSHANQDLALAAHAGVSVMQDEMHQQVLGNRFDDRVGWKASGFALPLLVPDVGELDWATIAAIRKHEAMKSFRRILFEIEATALDEARRGDIEAAVRHAFERYWVEAVGKVTGLAAIPKVAVVELGIGTMTGVLTSGFAGPVGVAVGAGVGASIATAQTAISTIRARRNKSWVSVYSEIRTATKTQQTSPGSRRSTPAGD
ncbi:hypothetical protein EXE59_14505 [Nocardioides eburneiflavus]|uniref:Uncharacterized protein n=1 Tax=Nocardioides eburneiflavus TaxID=2518372 RepID=A0A4Z1C6P2_9ACTN|nr:hypothetical protein [Nocardioides eburneiflavus]TGN65042.1 hypothetical protein EXE59_14505 [Nocardioides eburneiflavus]